LTILVAIQLNLFMSNLSKYLTKKLFLFLTVYIIALAICYGTGLKDKFSDAFRSNSSSLFSSFGDGGEINFKKKKKDNATFDTVAILTSKYQKQKARKDALQKGAKTMEIKTVDVPVNYWSFASIFFLFYLVLILATPIAWKSKILPLIVGFIVLYLFTISKIWIAMLIRFSDFYERFHVGIESETFLNVLKHFNNIISFPIFGLMLALIIWFVTCFNKIDLKGINEIASNATMES